MEQERTELLAVLESAVSRFHDLASQVRDPSETIQRSTWTAAEVVAHVTGGLEAYARYLGGDVTPMADVSDIAGGSLAASNVTTLAGEPERSISVLLDRAAAGLAAVTARANEHPLNEPVPWHGRPVPLRCLLATSIGEQLLHGLDLATTIGVPWPITRHEAVVTLSNLVPLLPLLVDPRTTRDLVASIGIELRGGPSIPLSFDHGTLDVDREPRQFDATVNADPVAFLLVAYGRRSQWSQIMRGKLVAWGRRPWLALRLTSYLVRP